MSEMFGCAVSFNQRLDAWDVKNVFDMRAIFYGATAMTVDYVRELEVMWDRDLKCDSL